MTTMTTAALVLSLCFAFTPAQSVAADPDVEVRTATVTALDAAVAAWNSACTKPRTHGLCVSFASPSHAAKTCSAPRMGMANVTARGKAGHRAYADLVAVLEKAEALPSPRSPKDAAAYEAKLARARMAVADHDLEAYLGLHMPKNLEFLVEEWKRDSDQAKHRAQYRRQLAKKKKSVRRFTEFFDAKRKQGDALAKAYAGSKMARDPDVVLAAALKTAWVFQHFADELRTASVPKSLREPELRKAYCGALQSQSAAPERMAQQAAEYCVEKAKTASVTGAAVDDCRALAALY